MLFGNVVVFRSVGGGNVVADLAVFGKKFLDKVVIPFGFYDDHRIALVFKVEDKLVCLREKVYRFYVRDFISAFDDAEPQEHFFIRNFIAGTNEYRHKDDDEQDACNEYHYMLNAQKHGGKSEAVNPVRGKAYPAERGDERRYQQRKYELGKSEFISFHGCSL